jgi:hypothetical protein
VACGGTTQTSATDAGVTDAGAACPTALPTAGGACTLSVSIACEYGTDVDSACNHTAVCAQGFWSVAVPVATVTCPTPAATGACPATYDAIAAGADCPDSTLICGYAQGWCACLKSTVHPSSGGPPLPPEWACDRPATGCPLPRPLLGSACTTEQQTCSYGACTLAQGVVEECTGGSWEPVESACPEARPSGVSR